MSEPVKKVALLGAGYIAEWHAMAVKRAAGAELVAVCDLSRGRAEALAAAQGVAGVYDNLDALLAESGCDAVHVLLPPQYHAEPARTILEAGKDVFLEKPMCVDSADCDALRELGEQKNRRVGVNHNFLFLPSYEKLKQHATDGRLGPLDHVTIDWQFPLGQLEGGPFNHWMFADPTHILFEIAPHALAFVIDLVGNPDDVQTTASNPVDLPGGNRFYRRWQVRAYRGGTAIDVNLSFMPGFANRAITARGRAGLARCDYERDVYTLDRDTKYSMVFNAFHATRDLGRSLQRQARSNLLRQVKSLGKQAPFGLSICRSVDAFYWGRGGGDPRLSAAMGADVIRLAERVAEASGIKGERTAAKSSIAKPQAAKAPTVLVLGGTGFIGRHLVRKLVEAGHGVRVMSRNAGATGFDDMGGRVDIFEGRTASRDDMLAALDGIDTVYHLARAYGDNYDEYYRNDVLVTKQIAECCLEKSIRRLIYTGTIDSYFAGKLNGAITESTGLDPDIDKRNDYARAKAAGEAMLMEMHREKGLPLVIVRPGIVIGSGGSPLHWGVGMWPAGSVVSLWGDGKNKLPIVLVEDVADGLLAAMDAEGIEGESFNLIGEPLLSAREYLDACRECAGIDFQTHATPIWRYYAMDMLKYGIKKAVRRPNAKMPSYRDWESRTQRARFDCTKAKERLGWKPADTKEKLIQKGIVEPIREMMM